MRIGACGMACGVCKFYEKGACTGCFKGTDERASAKLDEFKNLGFYCPALECAIKNKVSYCLSCKKLPCEVMYENDRPYGRELLEGGFTSLRDRLDRIEKGEEKPLR